MKGIIYYTDNRLAEPIVSVVREQILKANLPITSCSLNKPIDFGNNIVVKGERGYPTMLSQIITALENSEADYVFFCEQDVLYPVSHFDFLPQLDNIFYYNEHVWRWMYGSDTAITYDRLLSLSALCVNRKFALDHYRAREEKMYEMGVENFQSREPKAARIWGYEPGTKKTRRGGFSNDDFETWRSEYPIVDIRHSKTFSSPKVTLDSFKHAPTGWKEINIDKIPGWNLRKLFK
jgi:hypothetical protein